MARYSTRPQYKKEANPDYIQYIRSMYGEDNSAEHARTLRALRDALKTELTPRQMQITVMYYIDGMKQHEVAEALGINKSTVCRTLARSKAKLRKCLRYCSPGLLAA